MTIRVEDEDEYVHYPASPDDIRNVIRLLPKGAMDGIDSVLLCLGTGFQIRRNNSKFSGTEPDPYTGRSGDESLPGVYTGRSLGVYTLDQRKIYIFAYVYDPALPEREMWELYMRLHMLSTFVHEAAHHYDNMSRVARGRWLTDSKEKREIYAEKGQHDWTQSGVIPYLRQAYPEQSQAIEDWVDHSGRSLAPVNAWRPTLHAQRRTSCHQGRAVFDILSNRASGKECR